VKLLILCFLSAAAQAEVQVTVRIVNADVVPERIRTVSERVASEILASAGVGVTWVECPEGESTRCRSPRGRKEFWLHLLNCSPPRRMRDSTGFAVLYPIGDKRDGYAGVFYQKVTEEAGNEDIDPAVVLGATMAHEIGHVLLGSNAHAIIGAMRARLRREEFDAAVRGALRFTPQEKEAIRRAWDNNPTPCPTPKSLPL
jgi:hypothetical protein